MCKIFLVIATILMQNIAIANNSVNKNTAATFEEKMQKPQFYVGIDKSDVLNKKNASTLVISCVDFRLQKMHYKLLSKLLGLKNDYDNLSLPGASLAMISKKYPAWNQAINEVIPLLRELHKIKRVILLDHRDCGAYKLILGTDNLKTAEMELATHKKIMLEVKQLIESQYPDMKVYSLLVGLDGIVENLV